MHMCVGGCSKVGRGQLLLPRKHLCGCCLSNNTVMLEVTEDELKRSKSTKTLSLCWIKPKNTHCTRTVNAWLAHNTAAHVNVWTQLSLGLIVCSSSVTHMEKQGWEKGGQTDGENTNQDLVTQRHSKTTTSKVGERMAAHVRVCAMPYLDYLCAGVRHEVLLVGIYDSHLDQSIGLPVSAWGHQIITGYREEEREEGRADRERRGTGDERREERRRGWKMRGEDFPLGYKLKWHKSHDSRS